MKKDVLYSFTILVNLVLKARVNAMFIYESLQLVIPLLQALNLSVTCRHEVPFL